MAESSLYPTALDSTNLYEVVARLSTTLTADITADTTTIPLASIAGFPTQGYIVIDNETIRYISVGGASVDATGGRGHAGTAASHTNTTQVLVAVTAAVINKLRAGMIAIQTYAGTSGGTQGGINAKYLGGSTQGQLQNAVYLGGSTQGQLVISNIQGVSTVAGTTAMENDIVFTPLGFKFDNQAPASLGEVVGTSAKPAIKYLVIGATQQADAVNFKMPRSYNGQTITLEYYFSAATVSVTHDLGVRGRGISGEYYNPNYLDTVYMGTQTAYASSNCQVLVTKNIAAVSLGFVANYICYLGLIGGTITNNVRIHNLSLRWDKG